ncbi:zinc finger protein 358 [Cydia strobilella]|uniref:zinc finger protein 358 n=1 Tax=Cydia strobilella TaxID=1100964 RepID=UPI003007C3D8
MDGEGEDFNLHWEEEEVESKHIPGVVASEVICGLDNVQAGSYSNMSSEVIIQDTDQIAAENLMFLSQDVVSYTDAAELAVDPSVECVTEEVITDDWTEGQDSLYNFRVEVPLEHFTNPVLDIKEENDIDVPLPTDQDQYTAMRPWPCDFCSRRFRKKAALMNHMVAHQNDRPHACNLCGVRYVRKCDLMNHLKVHAMVPDNADPVDYEDVLDNSLAIKPKKKRGRRKKNPAPVPEENGDVWENMTSARTMQWSRRGRSPARPPRSPPPLPSPSPPSEPEPCPPPADPSRPFVCRHCGVGFAREKALQSHSRIHGGDSPIECGTCGELCWSREALATHARQRHPHQPPQQPTREPYDSNSGDDDMEYQLSPLADSGSERAVYDTQRGPELFCQDCGVAFQRADLLRRHQAAAHSHKRHDSSSSTWAEHSCDVCGETCADALQLLAHAERHADRPASSRFKKMSRGRNNTSSSGSRQFPCRECGKVFGSRSSQQIHIRIHTGERPYACRFCWKAFADGGTLRKHERIHTGEKPYACAVCPRAFNQRVVLREHVRSHHSAPDRRANGGPSFCCVVCGRTLHSSAELVQHLIQHCDANTALKRQPQTGPRKYKRRRKIKSELSPRHSWERGSPSPLRSPSPSLAASPSPSPTAAAAPATPPRRRRRAPPPRPKMIHTEPRRAKPKPKQVRGRRPPRHPADDLRAIAPRSPTPSPEPAPAPPTPSPPLKQSPPSSPLASPQEGGPFKCEMCAEEFPRRDALLLHVPVHI